MRNKYPVTLLCEVMSVNKSGYYKWKKRQNNPNRYERVRKELTELIIGEHNKHPSYGYHRLSIEILKNTGWIVSHNLVHKCCKFAGIRSKARHYKSHCGEESELYPNVVRGRWKVQEPLQIVVSDMTIIKTKHCKWEWTLMVDVFNNEILAHSVSSVAGSNSTYFKCLENFMKLLDKKEGQTLPTILHTDQGSVYSSRGFGQTHKDYNIIRSMSRRGTPTDNAVIEALNGWMKEELYVDFDIYHATDVPALLEKYVQYYNNERAAYALDYKSPLQYKTEMGF